MLSLFRVRNTAINDYMCGSGWFRQDEAPVGEHDQEEEGGAGAAHQGGGGQGGEGEDTLQARDPPEEGADVSLTAYRHRCYIDRPATLDLNSHSPREINFLQYKIIGTPKKLNKWPRSLFRPKTIYTCHQKPKSVSWDSPFNTLKSMESQVSLEDRLVLCMPNFFP